MKSKIPSYLEYNIVFVREDCRATRREARRQCLSVSVSHTCCTYRGELNRNVRQGATGDIVTR